MNIPFKLQIDFKNDYNWINAFFVELKICRHIRLHRRHGIYNKKKAWNLHKNSVFLKRYIINNVIVMENYKWCFRKQFLTLVKHKCRPHVWQYTKVLWSESSFLQRLASHLLLLELGMWVRTSLGIDGS